MIKYILNCSFYYPQYIGWVGDPGGLDIEPVLSYDPTPFLLYSNTCYIVTCFLNDAPIPECLECIYISLSVVLHCMIFCL